MIIDEEEYLEHFGVKGMKWGHRRRTPLANAKRDAKIDAARAAQKQFKADYKQNKELLGRKIARKILKEENKKVTVQSMRQNARLNKSGKEQALNTLFTVGGLTLSAALLGSYVVTRKLGK